jgi:hypothetical protein
MEFDARRQSGRSSVAATYPKSVLKPPARW